MTDKLVCPDCGHDTFERRRPVIMEYEVQFVKNYEMLETGTEAVYGSDDWYDEFKCADCGEHYYDESELVTEEVYNADDEEELDSNPNFR